MNETNSSNVDTYGRCSPGLAALSRSEVLLKSTINANLVDIVESNIVVHDEGYAISLS